MTYQPSLFEERTFETQREFPSDAPINIKKFKGDNLKVFNLLLTGAVINRTSPGMGNLTLHSRISDLRNKFLIPGIMDRSISVVVEGKKITISEYWLEQEEIQRIKKQWA